MVKYTSKLKHATRLACLFLFYNFELIFTGNISMPPARKILPQDKAKAAINQLANAGTFDFAQAEVSLIYSTQSTLTF